MGFFDKIFGNRSESNKSKDLAQDSKSNIAQNSAKVSHDSRESIINSAKDSAQNTTKPRKVRKNYANLNIATPCKDEMQKWINLWSEQSKSQDSALHKLFHRTYPRNDDLDEASQSCYFK